MKRRYAFALAAALTMGIGAGLADDANSEEVGPFDCEHVPHLYNDGSGTIRTWYESICPNTAGFYLLARNAEQNGDWSRARNSYGLLLLRDEDNPDLHQKVVFTAMNAGIPQTAIEHARYLYDRGEADAFSLFIISVEEAKSGRFDQALELLDSELLKDRPKDELSEERGLLEDLAGAMRYFKKNSPAKTGAIDMMGMSVNAVFTQMLENRLKYYKVRGAWGVYKDIENLRERTRFFHIQTLLFLDPDWSEARFELTKLLQEQEQYTETISQLNRIGSNDPLYFSAQTRIASVLFATGQKEKAFVHLSKLLTLNSPNNFVVYATQGDLYQRDGQHAEAIDAYTKALEGMTTTNADGSITASLVTNLWSIYFHRAVSYEATNRWDKAEENLRQALRHISRSQHNIRVTVLNYLGYGLADRGIKLEQAKTMLAAAVEITGRQNGFILDSLGWVHYKMGNYKDAIMTLEEAVAVDMHAGSAPDILEHLGDAYWQAGKHQKAKFQWTRALNELGRDKEPGRALLKRLQEKTDSGLTGQKTPATIHSTTQTFRSPQTSAGPV